MENIFNWGVFPIVKAKVHKANQTIDCQSVIKKNDTIIARGNGRCYGDSSLNESIFSTLQLNKFLDFDVNVGILKVESGVSLDDILQVIVPKGYFLPVTPGTKFITIGGAVGSNIHGKNHHKEGAISRYIISFDLINENGETITCSRTENETIFTETIGGMGLTGIIINVTLQLRKIETAFIKQKSLKAKNLNEILDLFEKHNHYTYSVAWIDCLTRGKNMGKSILMLGEHAQLSDLKADAKQKPFVVHSQKQLNIPFMFPTFILNKWSIAAFNFLYYTKQLKKEVNNIIHYNPYFYPLDAVDNWNRIYGKGGFTQYQFVIPFEKGREGLHKIMEKITASGCGSFLAVLKTMGKKESFESPISFPNEGYTLALDFKISPKVLALLDELDELVKQYNGKLYLTKDARMKPAFYKETYPDNFSHPTKFQSTQSKRLHI